MTSTNTRAYIALALAMTIVGSSVVSGKYTVESFPIFIASAIRFILAVVILVALVLFREGRIGRLSLRAHGVLFLQSLTGIVMFNAFMLAGLERTSASTSGIITSATPVMILLLSLLFGERLNRRSVQGIAIATVGLVVLNLYGGNDGESGRSEVVGGLLVVAAVIGEALYTIFGKLVTDRLTPLSQAMWVSVYGAAMFLPLSLFELSEFSISDTRASGWIAIVYSAIFVTVLAFILWFSGLRSVPASRAGTFTGMIPVSAVVLAAIILKESIGWSHVVGIACVLTAILLISTRSDPDVVRAPAPG